MSWELIAFVCGGIAVSAGCLVPARWLPPLPNDKVLHFIAFGGLALLAGRIAQSGSEQALWLLALLFASWIIEVLQSRVPGRAFCWRDMAANACGIGVAAIISMLLAGK